MSKTGPGSLLGAPFEGIETAVVLPDGSPHPPWTAADRVSGQKQPLQLFGMETNWLIN